MDSHSFSANDAMLGVQFCCCCCCCCCWSWSWLMSAVVVMVLGAYTWPRECCRANEDRWQETAANAAMRCWTSQSSTYVAGGPLGASEDWRRAPRDLCKLGSMCRGANVPVRVTPGFAWRPPNTNHQINV
jgi:hypothetical protein